MADEPKSDEIIKEARERFRESQDGTDYNRKTALEDIRFARLAEQWPDEIRKQRQSENRPCLTVNKMPAFIRQVVNDSRQNKPAINVHPVDNGADEATAQVIGGLIRSIERRSHADVAYDTAVDHAASGGFGFFQIAIDYAHEQTFDMECRIERVPNPLMVHWDSSSTAFDASDWWYAFVSDLLSKEAFKKRYPGAADVDFDDDDYQNWVVDNDQIRLASYWLRTETKKKLLLLDDGRAVREDQMAGIGRAMAKAAGLDFKNGKDADFQALFLSGRQVTKEREVRACEVVRRIISGVEVLEEDPWPGSMIPVCPVWGEEVMIDGRRVFRSMIRDARDPQTMFNFWRSASTELVALAPRTPWIGPKGFVPKGQEGMWLTANTRSHAYLEFEGQQAPHRQEFAGVPAGVLQESLNANDDMKSVIGIYDPSLGARSNETSGKAILARQKEADVSNFHFIDNLARAIRYAGELLVEIIPHVYTDRQTLRVLGEDQKEQIVKLAQSGNPEGQVDPNGKRVLYDLSVGKYDVEVKTGPSYGTQREETRETLIEIMRAVPQAAQYIGDMVLEHMDFQGADKAARRLQMLLPPQIQKAEGIQVPEMPQAQPNPLEIEKAKAQIENLRASAMANLAKAGATKVDSLLAEIEAVLNALNTVAPQAQGTPGAPAQPGQPPAQPNGMTMPNGNAGFPAS